MIFYFITIWLSIFTYFIQMHKYVQSHNLNYKL